MVELVEGYVCFVSEILNHFSEHLFRLRSEIWALPHHSQNAAWESRVYRFDFLVVVEFFAVSEPELALWKVFIFERIEGAFNESGEFLFWAQGFRVNDIIDLVLDADEFFGFEPEKTWNWVFNVLQIDGKVFLFYQDSLGGTEMLKLVLNSFFN